MTPEDSYKKGQEAYYHEDGEVFRVRVLRNKSDEHWLRYTLQILSVERTDADNPPESGTKFSVDKNKRIACGGLWHLLDQP